MNVGDDTNLQGKLNVQGSTSLNDGLSVNGDVNINGGVTSTSPMNAPAFIQTSDYRAKHILEVELSDCLNIILKLQPKLFAMKDSFEEPPRIVSGLIAHEVAEIIQHPVYGRKDGEQLQKLDYIQLIAYLIGAIQHQQEQIKELQERINVCARHHIRYK